MGEENKALRRIEPQTQMPVDLSHLPESQQMELRRKYAEQQIELNKDAQQRVVKSKVAEHDLAVSMDAINNLDHERKIYTYTHEAESGSGKQKLTVRGGDTKFIIPILIIVAVIVLGIVLILALRK